MIKSKLVKAEEGQLTAFVTGLTNGQKYEISVVARNDKAVSEPSNVEECIPQIPPRPAPKEEPPILADRYYENTEYTYALFDSDKGTKFTPVRTEAGANTECEVLLIGAGGSGKGLGLMGAKGGDGGGGQLVITKLPAPGKAGTLTISTPVGGTYNSDSPANTTVTEGTTVLTAIAGKSATDKNDAAGYPREKVPEGWNTLSMFTWLMPGSQYVGGTAIYNEQNYPNATFTGQGGVGTKDSRPGTGGGSFVAIRWKK